MSVLKRLLTSRKRSRQHPQAEWANQYQQPSTQPRPQPPVQQQQQQPPLQQHPQPQPQPQPQPYANGIPYSPSAIRPSYEVEGKPIQNRRPPVRRRSLQDNPHHQPAHNHTAARRPEQTREDQLFMTKPSHDTGDPAEEGRAEKQSNSSSQKIRYLRSRVREKYRLDLSIWGYRDVLEDDRDVVQEKYTRSDYILNEIKIIVAGWDASTFTKKEWQVAQMIQESILANEKDHILWTSCPPWDRVEDYEDEY